MKRALTLAIAIGFAGTAFGQSSTHVRSAPPADAAKPLVFEEYFISRTSEFTLTPNRVVITRGGGGLLYEHNMKYAGYRNAGMAVEVRGPCCSACTLITAYVGKDKLCIGQGAFFAFHQARAATTKQVRPAETALMYWQQPEQIRDWIDRNGGHAKLPLDGFWTMYDHELWAMGYQKCKPEGS